MKTIIYTHPWAKSFNHGILETLTTNFAAHKEAYQVIDLYQDKFNPVFDNDELAQFNKGTTPYPLVKDYQAMLKQTDELIIIFPIWWSTVPAILKGFIDKVMLPGFAYNIDDTGWHGLLTNIKKTTVITTSESPWSKFTDSIQGQFIDSLLPELGLPAEQTTWRHFDGVEISTPEARAEFLKELADL